LRSEDRILLQNEIAFYCCPKRKETSKKKHSTTGRVDWKENFIIFTNGTGGRTKGGLLVGLRCARCFVSFVVECGKAVRNEVYGKPTGKVPRFELVIRGAYAVSSSAVSNAPASSGARRETRRCSPWRHSGAMADGICFSLMPGLPTLHGTEMRTRSSPEKKSSLSRPLEPHKRLCPEELTRILKPLPPHRFREEKHFFKKTVARRFFSTIKCLIPGFFG